LPDDFLNCAGHTLSFVSRQVRIDRQRQTPAISVLGMRKVSCTITESLLIVGVKM
jgi:hypothetical protein